MTVREMLNSASDDAIAHEAGERACPNPYTGRYCREGIKKFLQSEATETKADRIKKGR